MQSLQSYQAQITSPIAIGIAIGGIIRHNIISGVVEYTLEDM